MTLENPRYPESPVKNITFFMRMDFSNYKYEVFDQGGILQKSGDIPQKFGKPVSVSENGQIFLFSQVDEEKGDKPVNEVTIVVLLIDNNDISMKDVKTIRLEEDIEKYLS